MRILTALILTAGLLMTQGCCCFFGKVFNMTPANGEAPAKPAKVSKKAKASMDEQASELAKVAETTKTDNGLIVHLKGDVLFAKGKNELSAEAAKMIDDIAAVLKKYPGTKSTVYGYTDNRGNKADNLALSKRRASAVKAELVKGGVRSSNVSSVGKGDADPVAPNDTDANRAKNRRAEIKIEPLKK